MINGLSLFTGYAGIDIALAGYVSPLLYCEIEKYAQGILLSRMDDGSIPFAPIWNDVTTLDGAPLKGMVDIIYGGFPCQDISVAGKGIGLEGKRSGLFFEVARLCKEIAPEFIFLENVPAIRTRGAIEVQETLSGLGYDSRWLTLSAAEVGANHKRERWFCLAHANGVREPSKQDSGQVSPEGSGDSGERNLNVPYADGYALRHESDRIKGCESQAITGNDGEKESVAHSDSHGHAAPEVRRSPESSDDRAQNRQDRGTVPKGRPEALRGEGAESTSASGRWAVEPDVGRVVDGCPERSHRIKALGNGVVPLQVRTAFEILTGSTKVVGQ